MCPSATDRSHSHPRTWIRCLCLRMRKGSREEGGGRRENGGGKRGEGKREEGRRSGSRLVSVLPGNSRPNPTLKQTSGRSQPPSSGLSVQTAFVGEQGRRPGASGCCRPCLACPLPWRPDPQGRDGRPPPLQSLAGATRWRNSSGQRWTPEGGVVTVSHVASPRALSPHPVAGAGKPRALSFRGFLPLVLESASRRTTCFSGGGIC